MSTAAHQERLMTVIARAASLREEPHCRGKKPDRVQGSYGRDEAGNQGGCRAAV